MSTRLCCSYLSATNRLSLALLLGLLSTCPVLAVEEPGVTLRQTIVRAPATRVAIAAMQHADDEALAAEVLKWLEEGSASVVSEVSGLMHEPMVPMKLRLGHEVDHVTQYDQDLDKALLTPRVIEKVFIGTALEGEWSGCRTAAGKPFVRLSLGSSFSPRGPDDVNWPVWWPENKEPLVNAYEQQDFFMESVITAAPIFVGGSAVLAIMRPADVIEFKPFRMDKLDVVILHTKFPGRPPDPANYGRGSLRADPFVPSREAITSIRDACGRFTFIGFGMPDRDAVELLSRDSETSDKDLLDRLMKKLDTGDVALRMFSSIETQSGQRATLNSTREHKYPSEMPTIPSGWSEWPIGDRVEVDPSGRTVHVALEHHPAPPRTARWPCALDSPALFMIQPQFFVRKITTLTHMGKDGVTLLSVMRTPDCNAGGKGLVPGETLVMFAKLDGLPDLRPRPQSEPEKPNIELEAVVFDIPASEAPAWEAKGDEPQDATRFKELMNRLERKDVKLAAHIAAVCNHVPYNDIRVDAIECAIDVTEIDGPRQNSPTRFRPTAMEGVSTGTTWELRPELTIKGGELMVELKHKLQHDTAPPRQPTCQEFIDTAMKTDGDAARASFFEETWEGKEAIKPGGIRFIGVRLPPGEMHKDRIHAAFLRARVTPVAP